MDFARAGKEEAAHRLMGRLYCVKNYFVNLLIDLELSHLPGGWMGWFVSEE